MATGSTARAFPASEILINPEMAFSQRSEGQKILFAVSRSGSTSETIKAVEEFKRKGLGKVVAVTNYGEEPLAGLADLAFVIPNGQEQSVTQTRSFSSMYVCINALCLVVAYEDTQIQSMAALPCIFRTLLAVADQIVKPIGEDLTLERFYFLGNGPRYGLASEVSLKMKEMTLSHSEPFHFLEFRHGPISMVNKNTLVIGLLSQNGVELEQKVLEDIKKLGGRVFTLSESNANISFRSGLDEAARNVLYLPALQLMAYFRSLAKGLNPDRPQNLETVVKLAL
jgi:glucosamine--fructose-6-phosphate aminotransferase (isomerizing)